MLLYLFLACGENKDVSFDFTSDTAETVQEPESTIDSAETEPETCDYPAETEFTPAIELDGRSHCGETIYMSLCALEVPMGGPRRLPN